MLVVRFDSTWLWLECERLAMLKKPGFVARATAQKKEVAKGVGGTTSKNRGHGLKNRLAASFGNEPGNLFY